MYSMGSIIGYRSFRKKLVEIRSLYFAFFTSNFHRKTIPHVLCGVSRIV